jgi:hypothetical protein
MVARDLDDPAIRALRRHAEPVALALHDEHRDLDRLQLGQAALRWFIPSPRRQERKGETEDRLAAGLLHRATCDPCSEGAPSYDQRQALELVCAQPLEHSDPCLVQTLGRRGRAPPGDSVRLLDQRDCEVLFHRGVSRRDEVGRLDPTASAVPEDECASGSIDAVKVRPCRSGWRVNL